MLMSSFTIGQTGIFNSIREMIQLTTQVQVAKWGNSLGVRLPRDVAARAGLKAGARVEIDATRDGRIVISHSRRRFTLQELLKEMKPSRQHQLEDDAPRGVEIL